MSREIGRDGGGTAGIVKPLREGMKLEQGEMGLALPVSRRSP